MSLSGSFKKQLVIACLATLAEQAIFIFYGNGANGKSTLLETVSNMIGDYAMNTPVETLLTKKNDGGIGNDVARLKGARLVTTSEVEEGRRLSESLVKALTGGDKISGRFLYGEIFEYTPTFKIFLSSNHKP